MTSQPFSNLELPPSLLRNLADLEYHSMTPIQAQALPLALAGRDLIAQTVDIQHRGTNKIIVNPQQLLKGEIRSTGDVISVNRPPVVDVETFYSGRLIFE